MPHPGKHVCPQPERPAHDRRDGPPRRRPGRPLPEARPQVAVKVLRPELAAVIGTNRFLSEIETTANRQHPHILALFDSGAADGFLFYVMPFVEGESLRDRLTRETQLPIADALRKSRGRSTTPTATASSTATSSPRTSCCTTGARSWRTSASRSRRTRRASASRRPGCWSGRRRTCLRSRRAAVRSGGGSARALSGYFNLAIIAS